VQLLYRHCPEESPEAAHGATIKPIIAFIRRPVDHVEIPAQEPGTMERGAQRREFMQERKLLIGLQWPVHHRDPPLQTALGSERLVSLAVTECIWSETFDPAQASERHARSTPTNGINGRHKGIVKRRT